MLYKLTIGVVMAAAMLLFTGNAGGVEMGPSAADEQIETAYVEVKCDPCDYNIDYGDKNSTAEKGGIDEGTVKFKCDPCDYNIDYGETDRPVEK